MTIYDNAWCLQMFRDLNGRPTVDLALPDAKVYRLLSEANRQLFGEMNAIFPRINMSTPLSCITTDGRNYKVDFLAGDGSPFFPTGHAEVYLADSGGFLTTMLSESQFAPATGDIVFNSYGFSIPENRQTRFATGSVYIRCTGMVDEMTSSGNPGIKPPWIRSLIVFRALELWANTGGQQDPRPYKEMYDRAWRGTDGNGGFLANLTTRYRNSTEGSLSGVKWWRAWAAGSISPTVW